MTRQTFQLSSPRTTGRAGAGAAGYSLVAVILGLQLSTIVALIAVPMLGGYRAQYQLISASNQLAFEINRARMQAVGQNKNVRIVVNGTQYQRQTNSTGSNWATELTTTLPSGITAYPSGGTIQFDKRGMASTNSTIFLTNNLQWQYVATNVLGRVSVFTYGS